MADSSSWMDQSKTTTLNTLDWTVIMYQTTLKINLKLCKSFNLTCPLFLLSCTLSRGKDLLLLALQGPSRHLSKSCCLRALEVSNAPELPGEGCLFFFLRPCLAKSCLCCSGASIALGSEDSRALGLLNRLCRERNTRVHSTYMMVLTSRVTNGSANTFSQRWSNL